MASTQSIAVPSTRCPFLDVIPPELRLFIYEILVVTSKELKGRRARKNEKYGLDLAILRTSRQIYDEAYSLFFSKNKFCVTSIPDVEHRAESREAKDSASIQRYEPPFQPHQLSLIRHLTIDLLYYPANLVTEPASDGLGWRPVDCGAAAFITSLVSLLDTCGPKLRTLKIAAEVSSHSPPNTQPETPAATEGSFCTKKTLISFFMCDRDRHFARALSSIPVSTIPIHFEFPDCFYRMSVEPSVFSNKSILLLACQVLFCKSQVRIEQLLTAFEEGEEGLGDKVMKQSERVDLRPFVGMCWPLVGEDTTGWTAGNVMKEA